ncbi:hypothetical protein ACQKDA_06465 [Psychrobacter sp. NPDC078370]|jgi:heme/copper-type cytochrome/quinol oxidase subunit 4|uniref:hypothetical protein n=1 Tax=Psychrobacter TaxID=497 RepID=UPI000C7BCE43|nr:hypothetical protein [Psychrobacter sp. 4Bb]PKH81494.1 hypothetical protein CXF60_04585 [Psychrobacter sp. 4Bb]|tara:strand:- start:18911 stop:19447 length:537 start_codon:yes stop_codon:yes gene_type:complete
MMEDRPRIGNEILEKNLERIIGFVANCDSKVSYLLSAVGVILTILFTVKPMNLTFLKSALGSDETNVLLGFSMLAIILSLFYFLQGVYQLSQALTARTKIHSGNSSSMIFFGAISAQAGSHDYLQSIEKTDYSYREDLACQIYINSKICTEKFEKYNKGFKFILLSLPFLIISWCYLF